MYPLKEAFIRNFSTPYSLLQRHLVGEKDGKVEAGGTKHPHEHQQSPPPRHLITELTTSSFLPCVMDLQKVCLGKIFVLKMDVKTKNLNLCAPAGRSAVLLHSVVWILLCSQSHHYPAGQVIAGKQHHHCGQVCCVASSCFILRFLVQPLKCIHTHFAFAG